MLLVISMKLLWAPWRLKYIKHANQSGCIFCIKARQKRDRKNFIFHRGEFSFGILNLFPYNSGHYMVAPYAHTGRLETLGPETLAEMFEIVRAYNRRLHNRIKPHGFNIGINLGRVAGAGIVDHVHIHVVPRWNGDTNFMPVTAETKIIPQAIEETYKLFTS